MIGQNATSRWNFILFLSLALITHLGNALLYGIDSR
jgi:hypothetical protein